MFRPVRQRLVRTHPVTGRKSLFLSAHAGGIVGWPVPEARAFLRDLVEHATQPRFVYSHKWRQWDLVISEPVYALVRKLVEVGEAVRLDDRRAAPGTVVYPVLGPRGEVPRERRRAAHAPAPAAPRNSL